MDDTPEDLPGPPGWDVADPEGGATTVTAPPGLRNRWVAVCGAVSLVVVTVAVLGVASPTAPATRPAASSAGPSPVHAAAPGTATTGPPATGGEPAPSTTTPTTVPPTTVPPTTVPAPPSTVAPPSTLPAATAPAVPANDVGIQVTGTGQASMTVVDGATQSQVNDVTLPWSTVLTDSPSSVNVSAQSSDGSETATIACEVEGPGITPTANSSSGPFATVSCGTTLGP